MEKALLPNGNCSFVLSRDGNPISLDEGGNKIRKTSGIRYDTSTYADCFVIYGLSEYARVSGDQGAFEFSLDLYESVLERISREAFRTDPYPTPSGFRQHGVPMIMLETSRQLALTCDRFALDHGPKNSGKGRRV